MSEIGLVNKGDFESIRSRAAMTNLTSGDSRVIPVQVEELREHGFVISAAKRSAAQGHALLIEIHHPKGHLKSTARVTSSEEVDDIARLEVTLVQYNTSELEALRQVYAQRQAEIEELMIAMRGY